MIKRLAKNDSHRLILNHHKRIEELKSGVLSVKHVELEIEKDLTSKRLGNVEATIRKMTKTIKKLMTNVNVSQVKEISKFVCFSTQKKNV